MNQFVRFVKNVVAIDDQDLLLVKSKCRQKVVPKGKLLLKCGQVANQYYFIVSGGLRFYYETEGQENTTWVCFKDDFFTEISSLHPQKPTRFNIEAIEKTELIIIDKKDMDFLYAHLSSWEEFGRKIWEGTTSRMVNQLLNFQTLTAQERYLQFLKNSELVQKIPVKQLATILGITPNALSRIRKNIG
ncbi:Crp/Fnr family transcriptional regulator [Pedobacter sp. CCM 8938]|uniref:Crp/Fnr family transcriptional regulator n=1 Tax=Pedobacter fastidiosus TaxID=2765361 RepID=A0ABR7KX64_9SPHI|nr:Crp/Fnr family transcriptional regulator [Pedobacter fastidiosus]